jgi:acetyl esterase/lipase
MARVTEFHPDLRAARFLPPLSFGPRSTAFAQRVRPRRDAVPDDLVADDLVVPGPPNAPDVPVRVYRPRSLVEPAPALLWLHGGGMIIGDHLQDQRANIALVRELGITVVSVDYRLAPQHPAPAALEDAYAALTWLSAAAAELRVDPARIAVGGNSAGGGLAAGLALMCRDRGTVRPVFQLLTYPMLDDRTVTRTDLDTRNVRGWTPRSNRWAWSAYLGQPAGLDGVSDYAAPARRVDLSGLPPAWIGVGTLDLFHDEDVDYARRLSQAGVPCRLDIVPGAFHGFDAIMPGTPISQQFRGLQVAALRQALFPSPTDVADRPNAAE